MKIQKFNEVYRYKGPSIDNIMVYHVEFSDQVSDEITTLFALRFN